MIDNRYSDRYIVDTPESIEFGYDIAGVGTRFLAALLDTAIFFMLGTTVYFILDKVTSTDEFTLIEILFSIGSLMLAVYYIAFEQFWNGQTPGKRIFGIRVVQEAGRTVTFSASLIRNLVRMVDFLPLLYGFAVIMMFVDKRSRRLGDMAAGTLVVRDRQRVTLSDLLETVRSGRVASALADNTATLLPNLEAVRPSDIHIVQDFLLRRATLPQDRRQRLAGQLAYGLFQRLGYSVPGDPELFLQQITDQYVVMRGERMLEQRP